MSPCMQSSISTYTHAFPVKCGPLLLPPNGYITYSNDTLEGASISFVCITAHSETAVVFTVVCNQMGHWEPSPFDICQLGMYNNMHNTIIYEIIIMYAANKGTLYTYSSIGCSGVISSCVHPYLHYILSFRICMWLETEVQDIRIKRTNNIRQ